MTLKVRILQSLTRLFIILVSLMMSLFSEKMLIFNRCISGSMSNLIEKSWKVSIYQAFLSAKRSSSRWTKVWISALLFTLISLAAQNAALLLEHDFWVCNCASFSSEIIVVHSSYRSTVGARRCQRDDFVFYIALIFANVPSSLSCRNK